MPSALALVAAAAGRDNCDDEDVVDGRADSVVANANANSPSGTAPERSGPWRAGVLAEESDRPADAIALLMPAPS